MSAADHIELIDSFSLIFVLFKLALILRTLTSSWFIAETGTDEARKTFPPHSTLYSCDVHDPLNSCCLMVFRSPKMKKTFERIISHDFVFAQGKCRQACYIVCSDIKLSYRGTRYTRSPTPFGHTLPHVGTDERTKPASLAWKWRGFKRLLDISQR